MYFSTFLGAFNDVYIFENAYITDHNVIRKHITSITAIIDRVSIRSISIFGFPGIFRKVSKILNSLETRKSSSSSSYSMARSIGRPAIDRNHKMTTFLDLPFELQSQILGYAFEEALQDDLASQNVQPYCKVPDYNILTFGTPIAALSPMHQTTNTHLLFANMLPLTLESDVTSSTIDTLSPNQLTYCLTNLCKYIAMDSVDTKALMGDIVLRQPWARVTGETYCALWRRKGRAELVTEVIKSALDTLELFDEAASTPSYYTSD
jgi:hypothetical protein